MRDDDKIAIEEMAKALCPKVLTEYCASGICTNPNCLVNAKALEALYNAGYRKQSEGEWQIKSEIHQMFDDVDEELYVECPFCKRTFWVPYEFDDEKTFEYAREHYPYCNCGAKIGGGAE